jgi:LytS/YehU family sensor histidine kinase
VIPDDPQRGNELLLRFAQFIRYRLRNQTAFVTLADELAATTPIWSWSGPGSVTGSK